MALLAVVVLATGLYLPSALNAAITSIASSPEGLYYTRRQGAAKKLFRLPHGAAPMTAGEEIRLPFEGNVAISDVLDMYIGESEAKLHALFEKARAARR